jgi:hypothetical protein
MNVAGSDDGTLMWAIACLINGAACLLEAGKPYAETLVAAVNLDGLMH